MHQFHSCWREWGKIGDGDGALFVGSKGGLKGRTGEARVQTGGRPVEHDAEPCVVSCGV